MENSDIVLVVLYDHTLGGIIMSKDHKELKFDTEIGTKARVEHHTIKDVQGMDQLREVLADMGKDFQCIDQSI